jgi:lysophospholipase L1-like esterase
MTLSTSTVTLAPGSSRTYTLAPGEAVTVATEPNCYVTVTETPDVISSADLDGQTNVRTSILQYKGSWTYGPYALGGTVVVAVSLAKSTSSVAVTLGSAAAAVVGAAGAPRRDGRLLLDGDSQVERDWLTTATDTANVGQGIINHANIFGGRRYEVVDNLGVIGDTTDDLIARLPASIEAARSCGAVFLSVSTNDIFGDLQDSDHVITNLEIIFRRFMNAGVYVIWKNETPRTFVDATKVAYQNNVNAWAKEFERKNPGFSVFDAAAVIVNATSTQFAATANRLDGAVHYLNIATCLMGKAFNTKYSGMFVARDNLIDTASDTYTVSTTSGQLWGNPLFSGTAGTETATGGGTAPTGDTADLTQVDHAVNTAATCVCSLVSQADGFGQAQRIVIASNGASDRWTVRNITNITTGVSPGDLIELECDIRVSSATNLSGLPVFLQAAVDGGTIVYAYDNRHASTDVALPSDFVGGTFRTRRLRLPAGTAVTALQWRIEPRFTTTTGGGATIDISRLTVRNLTRLGLDV